MKKYNELHNIDGFITIINSLFKLNLLKPIKQASFLLIK